MKSGHLQADGSVKIIRKIRVIHIVVMISILFNALSLLALSSLFMYIWSSSNQKGALQVELFYNKLKYGENLQVTPGLSYEIEKLEQTYGKVKSYSVIDYYSDFAMVPETVVVKVGRVRANIIEVVVVNRNILSITKDNRAHSPAGKP